MDDATLQGENPRELRNLSSYRQLIRLKRKSCLQGGASTRRRDSDHGTLSSTLNNLAALEHHQDFARSEELSRGDGTRTQPKHLFSATTSQLNLGTINRARVARPSALYAQALATFEQNQDQSYTAIIDVVRASSNWTKGKLNRAKNKLDRAAASATVSEDLLVQTMSECWHGVGHWLEGEDEAAYLPAYATAAGLMKRQKNPKSSPSSMAITVRFWLSVAGQARRRRSSAWGATSCNRATTRNHLGALKVLVSVAAAALAREAHEAGDTAAYERHRNMATQRFDFAFQRTPNSEAFPNGLIHLPPAPPMCAWGSVCSTP